MKTLFLLRHAKSVWAGAGVADFDRPLDARGRESAPLVGEIFRRRNLRPGLLLSSPAERARQTARLVAEAAGLTAEVRFDERIYEADAARLCEVVSQIDETFDSALIVGHNPGLESLVELLTGDARGMSTAALACVALDVEEWDKACERSGRLEWLFTPRELEGGG